jgi:hypothetical protein
MSEISLENLEFDVIDLPSKGLLYPNKKSSVKVGYLTASDENILTSPNIIRSKKVLDVLLERKILDKEINYKDLLLGDRNAIIIWLRATGYGAEYETTMVDPITGEEFKHVINLQELNYKPLKGKPNENNEFALTLPLSKKNIKFKLLTVGDEEEIISRNEKYRKVSNSEIDKLLTYRLEKQITEIDGDRDKSKIAQFIEKMRAGDSLALRKYSDEIEPGVDLMVAVEGPSGETFQSYIRIGANFFWPNIGE